MFLIHSVQSEMRVSGEKALTSKALLELRELSPHLLLFHARGIAVMYHLNFWWLSSFSLGNHELLLFCSNGIS